MHRVCLHCITLSLLVLTSTGCQQLGADPLAKTSNTSAAAPVQLPAIPRTETVALTLGQTLQLPNRSPADRWVLDYDPAFWRQSTDANPQQLTAIRVGNTELVQREQVVARGSPAPRRFVYSITISP